MSAKRSGGGIRGVSFCASSAALYCYRTQVFLLIYCSPLFYTLFCFISQCSLWIRNVNLFHRIVINCVQPWVCLWESWFLVIFPMLDIGLNQPARGDAPAPAASSALYKIIPHKGRLQKKKPVKSMVFYHTVFFLQPSLTISYKIIPHNNITCVYKALNIIYLG